MCCQSAFVKGLFRVQFSLCCKEDEKHYIKLHLISLNTIKLYF